MTESCKRKSIDTWRGIEIPRGQRTNVFLPVSESYMGISLKIPIQIQRGVEEGPVVFITAALHGDELNGTGAIRELMGIDLHTAAIRRTNYPNVRADMSLPMTRSMAVDFGAEVILSSVGPDGSLRKEATRAGVPTIVMEGGEVWKVEPAIAATAVRGIKNVLSAVDMIDGEIDRPETQVVIETTKWIRAERGGFLQFHVRPGPAP